uniref:F-box domain-containing protein n=1 Tax=Oryza punctata TaxID=4537 RepID=A0A0E0LTV7_ORYPU
MADRLSELPDDLLIRILSFAPVKEAASTTLLSRRWNQPPLPCPAVTSLTMVNCETDGSSVEIDAPALINLRYVQITPFDSSVTLKSPAPCLARVELEQISTSCAAMFSSLLHGMCHIRVLKLKVYSITEDMKFVGNSLFPNLKHVVVEELCGFAMDNGVFSLAMAVGDLLRCCPTIRELRLRFRWSQYLHDSPDDCIRYADLTAHLESMACRLQQSDYCDCCKVSESDKPAGTRQDFNNSWQDSLRKIAIKFQTGKLTCFQVQLLKFLAENASVLEEFDIDGGNRHVSDHIKSKVGRWRDASSMEKEAPPGVGAGVISGRRLPPPSIPMIPDIDSRLQFPALQHRRRQPPLEDDLGGSKMAKPGSRKVYINGRWRWRWSSS